MVPAAAHSPTSSVPGAGADLVVDFVLRPVIDDLPTALSATAHTAPSASGAVSVTQKVPPRRGD